MMHEYISKKGFEKLKLRLKNLIQVERPAITDAISKAREFGDLSENAEYHAAKERQKSIEAEISKLQRKVATLKIINSEKLNKNEVRFGAIVELLDKKNNKSYVYQIVGKDETESDKNIRQISCNSPIAKSLLGKKIGDEATIKVPAGTVIYKITKIKYKENE
ncbi:MAG: transcription elongation factor GreA [Candidatus Cloacimonetes bacterium]|nr:transcription elongation factor GreA [Candidatus Cloacimonadota bacterium]